MNWIKLSEKEYRDVWDRFYRDFQFNHRTSPSIQSNLPILKFSIGKMYSDDDYPDSFYDKFFQLGHKLLLDIAKPDKRLYALDWQHECFEFDPSKGMDNTVGYTPSLVPDGDYYIYLTKDFSDVWFGHPWEQSITLVGDKIVSEGLELVKEFQEIGISLYK